MASALLGGVGGAPLGGAGASAVTGGANSAATLGCTPPTPTPPGSLLIPLAQHRGTLGHASTVTLGATVEFRAAAGTGPANARTQLYIPSIDANFYTASGSTIQLFLLHHNASIPATAWSPPTRVSRAIPMSTLFSSGNATLSTSWHALEANTGYGRLQVQFRWQWWLHSSGPKPYNLTSPWSAFTGKDTPHIQPTTLVPQPWVGVTRTSGATGSGGSVYSMTLIGNVSATHFRVAIEFTNSTEANSVCHLTPAGTSPYHATIRLSYANGQKLPTGNYLVHVHAVNAAVVVFEQVRVT
ncbi:MAG TPA: hypothetical protein VGV89_08375 [Thermoplasmata archaeon]|nr:hypothetical protein [Thermoplasmata archaeon]